MSVHAYGFKCVSERMRRCMSKGGVVIGVWLLECGYRSVVIRVWLLECVYQSVSIKVRIYQNVSVRVYLSNHLHQTTPHTL